MRGCYLGDLRNVRLGSVRGCLIWFLQIGKKRKSKVQGSIFSSNPHRALCGLRYADFHLLVETPRSAESSIKGVGPTRRAGARVKVAGSELSEWGYKKVGSARTTAGRDPKHRDY